MLPASNPTTSARKVQSGIYRIVCIPTGKFYVGSAVDISRRWLRHRKDLSGGVHHSRHLQRAWLKHGADSFVFEILEQVANPDDLIRVEQGYLDRLQPWRRTVGYNFSPTAGSCLGTRRSADTLAKMSASKKNPLPETRARMSEAAKNRSPEARANIAAANAATAHLRVLTPEGRSRKSAASKGNKHALGYRHTDEAKARISAARSGRSLTPEHRANIAAAKRKKAAAEGRPPAAPRAPSRMAKDAADALASIKARNDAMRAASPRPNQSADPATVETRE